LLWEFCDPYLTRVPDLLHHFNLGIIKTTIRLTMESLGEDQTNVLDEEISKTSINGLKNFKRGVLGIKNLKGWEYVDLAFHMPPSLVFYWS